MKVLLLGNGFDLNHNFPTSYSDFLNTLNFLISAERSIITTIGHVFGNEILQEKCKNIKDAYKVHAKIYNETNLEKEAIEQMVEKAQNNYWFYYLSERIAEKNTWIDFEKEIVRVLDAFEDVLSSDEAFFEKEKHAYLRLYMYNDIENKCIIKRFSFFYDEMETDYGFDSSVLAIRNEFVREKIIGSGVIYLCEDKIAEELYASLRELADLLKQYLKLFVDMPAQKYAELRIKPRFSSLKETIEAAQQVYSFNYTNTYEILYRPNIVEHIHGNTNANIVLGVNPDAKDDVHSIDTTFLQFKKYFQRTFYSTDYAFLRKLYMQIQEVPHEKIELYVVGHSLDVTDKDIIKLVFENAKKICIFHHSNQAAKEHIRNLVEIYGKDGLDRLRMEKNLVFLPLSGVEWIMPEA